MFSPCNQKLLKGLEFIKLSFDLNSMKKVLLFVVGPHSHERSHVAVAWLRATLMKCSGEETNWSSAAAV